VAITSYVVAAAADKCLRYGCDGEEEQHEPNDVGVRGE